MVANAAAMIAMLAAMHTAPKPAERVWMCDPPRALEQGSGTVKQCAWFRRDAAGNYVNTAWEGN